MTHKDPQSPAQIVLRLPPEKKASYVREARKVKDRSLNEWAVWVLDKELRCSISSSKTAS
jgi:predicted HicB family RNase H-like nuclease